MVNPKDTDRRAAPSPSDGEVARLRAELAILAAVSADAHSVEVLMKSAAALSRQSAELAEARELLRHPDHPARRAGKSISPDLAAAVAALHSLGCKLGPEGRWEIPTCPAEGPIFSVYAHAESRCNCKLEWLPIPGAGAKENK